MLLDVRPVFVVQDRASGAFVDINMGFCSSIRYAAKADSQAIANESIASAVFEGVLEFENGYDVYRFYLPVDED